MCTATDEEAAQAASNNANASPARAITDMAVAIFVVANQHRSGSVSQLDNSITRVPYSSTAS
jgi:hypothetical protein